MMEEFNTNLFDEVIEGIIIVENGFIKDINKSLLSILQYKSKNELLDHLVTGIIFPYNESKFINYNNEKYQESILINSQGKKIPSIIRKKELNQNSQILFILDLSSFKENEKLLIQKSKLESMGNLLSMIAHQWRQPLTAITGITSKLKYKIHRNRINDEILFSNLDEIENYLSFLSNTIDSFRDFFKKDTISSISDSSKVIDSVLKLVQSRIELNNINININKKELSKFYLNENEFSQVFLSIIENAIEILVERKIEKPTINISIEDLDDYQVVKILDNGRGIDNSIIDRVFEPYFTTKDDKNGLGIGLFMAKMIVEKHNNGKLKMFNQQNGVCFEIYIKRI